MKQIFALLFGLSVVCSSAFAETEFTTSVNFGDRISKFRIFSKGDYPWFSFSDSYGKFQDGPLTKVNYNYIVKIFNQSLKEKSNDMTFCRRQYITVKSTIDGKVRETKSCIGSPTKVAKILTNVANTLDLLL